MMAEPPPVDYASSLASNLRLRQPVGEWVMIATATIRQAQETAMATDYEAFTRMLMDDIRSNGKPTMGPMAGTPLMILTTKGARSGRDRSAIITYSRDGIRYVITGSKSGEPTHPAWFFNLKAHPEVTVEAGGETFTARATEASGAERERLWKQHVAEHPVFGEYPKLTDRVIPVIVLDRID
jgi:deazaflavin-dependent oxidoreductase (nitroreductase family)